MRRAQANDFGSEIIPGAKDMGMHVQAYLYQGYWEDIGTVEAFYESNLALTDNPAPKFRCLWPPPPVTMVLRSSAQLPCVCLDTLAFRTFSACMCGASILHPSSGGYACHKVMPPGVEGPLRTRRRFPSLGN